MSNKKEKRKKLDEKLNITTVSDEREVLVNLQVARATTSIAILSSSYDVITEVLPCSRSRTSISVVDENLELYLLNDMLMVALDHHPAYKKERS
jgi:hypothetical protein